MRDDELQFIGKAKKRWREFFWVGLGVIIEHMNVENSCNPKEKEGVRI